MADTKRILLAKMGLDCHDTGVITVAQKLREAGYEVIYLGLHNNADQVVKAAVEEAADAIGISFLSGQHMTQVRKLMDRLAASGLDLPVLCGGVIPADDVAELRRVGVAEVVVPGASSAEFLEVFERVLGVRAA
ncbi:MAG: cobalamin-dependent protein [Gammaproteobacteria bacterium]|nr:cobalamin-dependent protein [Gammaproteobacteria bacterium]